MLWRVIVPLRPEDMPIVDVAAFDRGDATQVENARAALRDHNFVALGGHSIDPKLLDRGYDCARRLFALPRSVKGRYAKGKGAVGYIPYGVEQALLGRRPDLKELWHHSHRPPAEHPARREDPDVYPENRSVAEVPRFDETLDALDRSFVPVMESLLRVLALAIDLPERFFLDLADGAPHMLRLVYYPPLPRRLREGEERAVAHTGAGLLGILPPATHPGLEIQRRDGVWQRLEGFDARTLVVTIADQMHRLTNGKITGSTHRVANPEGSGRSRERYAIVYFVSTRPKTLLWPPAELLAPGERPDYDPMTSWDFTVQRMQAVWINQASLPYRLLFRLRKRLTAGPK